MIQKSRGGTRKRGAERGSAFNQLEAFWTGSDMALKEAKPEAFRKLAPPPSLLSADCRDLKFAMDASLNYTFGIIRADL